MVSIPSYAGTYPRKPCRRKHPPRSSSRGSSWASFPIGKFPSRTASSSPPLSSRRPRRDTRQALAVLPSSILQLLATFPPSLSRLRSSSPPFFFLVPAQSPNFPERHPKNTSPKDTRRGTASRKKETPRDSNVAPRVFDDRGWLFAIVVAPSRCTSTPPRFHRFVAPRVPSPETCSTLPLSSTLLPRRAIVPRQRSIHVDDDPYAPRYRDKSCPPREQAFLLAVSQCWSVGESIRRRY